MVRLKYGDNRLGKERLRFQVGKCMIIGKINSLGFNKCSIGKILVIAISGCQVNVLNIYAARN